MSIENIIKPNHFNVFLNDATITDLTITDGITFPAVSPYTTELSTVINGQFTVPVTYNLLGGGTLPAGSFTFTFSRIGPHVMIYFPNNIQVTTATNGKFTFSIPVSITPVTAAINAAINVYSYSANLPTPGSRFIPGEAIFGTNSGVTIALPLGFNSNTEIVANPGTGIIGPVYGQVVSYLAI